MRKLEGVAVPFLLSLLALPLGVSAKHAATSPATGAPEAAPTAPPGERKPLLQQIRENPTKFGDDVSPPENVLKNAKPHSKTVHAAPLARTVPTKVKATHQTPAPAVPPKTVRKHFLQDVKENPTKYNDALPRNENKAPGKKERPEDQR